MVVALLFAGARATAAQTPTGTLEGTVVDSTGGVVVGASATALDLDTSQRRTALTDNAGVFRLVGLPVGTYRCQVTYPGISRWRRFSRSTQDDLPTR